MKAVSSTAQISENLSPGNDDEAQRDYYAAAAREQASLSPYFSQNARSGFAARQAMYMGADEAEGGLSNADLTTRLERERRGLTGAEAEDQASRKKRAGINATTMIILDQITALQAEIEELGEIQDCLEYILDNYTA